MIAIATTTITAHRPATGAQSQDPYDEGYDGDTPDGAPVLVAENVRATIAPGGARGQSQGSESEVAEFRLQCDPIPLSYLDTVTDAYDGTVYEVTWAITTPGVATLSNTTAGLRTVKGQAP